MNCDTCAQKFTTVNHFMQHIYDIKYSYRCSHFFCISCSLPLYDISNVFQHIGSEEHSIMALATDIHFDTKSEFSDNLNSPFPSLYCCFLCGFRDDNPHNRHLKKSTHIKMASFMRAIISSKKVYCSDEPCNDKDIQKLINKFISIKKIKNSNESFSDTFDCELCNVYFNAIEYYRQHLEDLSHKKMEQFMSKISDVVKDLEYIGLRSDVEVTDTFSNSLPPLYYCELCCVWVETTVKYVRHTKNITHKRIQELFTKLSNKKDGEVITLSGVQNTRDSHLHRSKEYCKLCTVWGATGYRRHLKDVGHIKIEKFLNSLSKEDKKFLKFYMNAQASLKVDNCTPPNYCVLCNILCLEYAEYKQHLESAEHKYVKKYYPKNGGEKSALTLRHRYYATMQKQQRNKPTSPVLEDDETESSSEDSGSGDKSAPQEHHCELCDFLCYSVLHYDKHLNGEQHKRMRRLLNKKCKTQADTYPCKTSSNSHPLQYKCELCEVFSASYRKYDCHLNTAMHKRNQWLLFVLKQRPI